MNKVTILFLSAVFLLLAVGGGGYYFFQMTENRGFPQALPVQSYLNGPTQLSGNRYHLEAEVRSLLESKPEVGRIFLVQSEGSGSSLPLFVPQSIADNLEFQQRYRFHLKIESDGLLSVVHLRKI